MKVSVERKRLLAQAFHGFAQRHPEATAAAIELEIAGAVGLSQVSVQKWRAGHAIAPEHIPNLAGWAVRQAGMPRSWLRAFLRACDYSDPRLEEHLFPSIPSDLPAVCQAANLRLWGCECLDAAMLYLPRRPSPLCRTPFSPPTGLGCSWWEPPDGQDRFQPLAGHRRGQPGPARSGLPRRSTGRGTDAPRVACAYSLAPSGATGSRRCYFDLAAAGRL